MSTVTERKRAEEERERLRQLEADLAHMNRVTMLGELASSLAHELNQPICCRYYKRQRLLAMVCAKSAGSGRAGPSLKHTVAACGPLLMPSVVRHFISPCLLGCMHALHLRRAGKGRFLASMSGHERRSRPLPDGHLPKFSKILPSKSNAGSFGRSRRRLPRPSSGSVCIGSLRESHRCWCCARLCPAGCVLGEQAGALEADL